MNIIPDTELVAHVFLCTHQTFLKVEKLAQKVVQTRDTCHPTKKKSASISFLRIANRIIENNRIRKRSAGFGLTWSLRFDDGLGRNAHAAFVERQLAAGQAVGPAVVVTDHHRLAARLGPLAHGLAWFDGLVLKVNGADGSIHGAEKEEQIWTAAGT